MTEEQYIDLKITRELAVWRVLEETQGDFQSAKHAAKVEEWLKEIFPEGL
jgi:hypothetical protein